MGAIVTDVPDMPQFIHGDIIPGMDHQRGRKTGLNESTTKNVQRGHSSIQRDLVDIHTRIYSTKNKRGQVIEDGVLQNQNGFFLQLKNAR